MRKIRIIYSDNEGCIIPGKGSLFPLDDLQILVYVLAKLKTVLFGICTGRSIPYVEAMTQILNIMNSQLPCVCEGGATLYWPKPDKTEILVPLNTDNLNDIFKAIIGLNFRKEPGKLACLSLYSNPPTTVDDIYNAIQNNMDNEKYNITKSTVAVDITTKGVSKSFGVAEVCKRLKISLSEVLYIGDSYNDIELLQMVGFSACPQNAVDDVKKSVQYVAGGYSTKGIIEIINHYNDYFY